jgi:NAD-specific glutamate dehydrogenase
MNVNDGILSTLKVRDFFNIDMTFQTINEIDRILGTNLSRENYNCLKKIFTGSLNWVEKNKIETRTPDPLSVKDFLLRFKKGSKPFRKVIENLRFSSIKNSRNNKIKKIFQSY